MSNFKIGYLPSGEILFKVYWRDMGAARSIVRLCNWCKSNGYVNPETGKKPRPMAVWFKMYRWMVKPENYDRAYEIFSVAIKNDEPHFSYELGRFNEYEFKQWLKKQAKTCLYGRHRVYTNILKSVE